MMFKLIHSCQFLFRETWIMIIENFLIIFHHAKFKQDEISKYIFKKLEGI
jgi:hypothetical protein